MCVDTAVFKIKKLYGDIKLLLVCRVSGSGVLATFIVILLSSLFVCLNSQVTLHTHTHTHTHETVKLIFLLLIINEIKICLASKNID